jgi:DNA polymerase-3 subunit delta
MTYAEFQQVAQKKTFAAVSLFYGEEDFLIEEGVRTLVESVVDVSARGFDLDVVYGSKVEAKDVIAHASSFPMMGSKRVVVVKEFEKLVTSETAKELFASYLGNPLPSTHLVLVSSEPDFRRKPFTDLKKKAELIECKPLYDNQVPSWIAHRVKMMGKEAHPEACRLLQAYVGNSLRALQNELEKIFIFIGDKKEIVPDDVTGVVGATKGFTVFELQNAIGRKDPKESLRILERMLVAGQSPQMIIVMLTRFFTQLWKLSDPKLRRVPEGEIAREIGISPYFLKQHMAFSGGFSVEHLENAFRALLEADTLLKSTPLDPHLVMDLLVVALISGTAEPLTSRTSV